MAYIFILFNDIGNIIDYISLRGVRDLFYGISLIIIFGFIFNFNFN